MDDSIIDSHDGYGDPPPSKSSYLPITPPLRRRQNHDELLKDPPTYQLADIPPCATDSSGRQTSGSKRHLHPGSTGVESQYELPDAGHDDVPENQGSYICECCPRKPKKFDTEEDLRLHVFERSYTCAYCPSRFKRKNDAERHQSIPHISRHAWSCGALIGSPVPLLSTFSLRQDGVEVCGYCGNELPDPENGVLRVKHLVDFHKVNGCNRAKTFLREDHFRQHLKHSHAATIGKWTNGLVNACRKDGFLPKDTLSNASSTAAQRAMAPSTSETAKSKSSQQIYSLVEHLDDFFPNLDLDWPVLVEDADDDDPSTQTTQLQGISQRRLSTISPHTRISGDKKDDNSFDDSGYASMSRASKSSTQTTSEQCQTTAKKIQLPDVEEEDDIQSIISDESHIGSDASVHTSTAQHEGKAYFARFLADDKNVRTLLEPLLHRMGIDRFSNTMRKLLKAYYKDLSRTAKTEIERVSVALLKSRRGRRRIGELIAGYLSKHGDNDDDENNLDPATTSELAEVRMSLLEDWLANIQHKVAGEGGSKIHLKHHNANNRSQGLHVDDSDIGSESDGNEHVDLSYLTEMQAFFHDSVAFGELVQNLTTLLLPHPLAQIIFSTRKGSISISHEADVSSSNKWKGQVERFTQVDWDWWPLPPHMRDLKPSESRIHWTCVCGTRLWKEINHEEAAVIKATLPYLADTPLWPHRCRTKDQRSLFGRLYRFLAPSQCSSAQKRYTPQTSSTSQSCAASNIASRTSSQGALSSSVQGSSTQQSSIANQHQPAPHANASTPNDFWILFGVQGRRKPLDMSHIPILQQSDDSTFYRTLKSNYRRSRGRFRLWFSFWRLEYCEVVKFKRIASRLVIRERKELPLEQEYEYSPRPPNPNATNPTITRHEFSMHLNACEEPCRWASFHECMPQLKTTYTIETIPKRCQQFNINSNDSKDMFAWGLEAKHVVSARHLVVYHLVAFMLPFGLFIWWMIAFDGDIQGAAVPAAVFIGAVSLFWSTSGVLIQSRHNNDGLM